MASESEDFVFFVGKGEEIQLNNNNNKNAPQKAPLLNEILGSEDENSSPEATQQEDNNPASAVNEETGEINWDCPCLKSALEPPCGHTFKAAFACFVASKTEPKGLDCHGLFKAMQECFQAHPEKYGSILEDDDDSEADDELDKEFNDNEHIKPSED